LCKLMSREDVSIEEKYIFLIAFVPHVQPDFFDGIVQQYLPNGGDFAEIGGVRGSNQRSMLPTGETAKFILAGNNIEKRLAIQEYLLGGSTLIQERFLHLEKVKEGEPHMSGRIMLDEDYAKQMVTNKEPDLKFSPDFPAKKVETKMTWNDLILSSFTQNQINDIQVWIQHNQAILKDDMLGRKLKPGYRALFYGPPGTGKTLTATLLGKQFGKDVYRIDLSQVVSKYIGETEKNLEKVFEKAENKNWILFFDEADALFGKRTNVQNSHDRYANQEVSYLLQRIEDYPGLLILASNLKNNIDTAFLRRFHTIIHFPAPNAAERLTLWQKTLPANFKIEPDINLQAIADKYELTGAAILSIVHYATLKAISTNDPYLRQQDLLEAIRREYRKEERSI